jgi:hypothetical protein
MKSEVHDLNAQAWAARQRAELLAGELAESRRKTRETLRLIRDSQGETARLRAWRQAYRTGQDRLRYSEYARLRNGPGASPCWSVTKPPRSAFLASRAGPFPPAPPGQTMPWPLVAAPKMDG